MIPILLSKITHNWQVSTGQKRAVFHKVAFIILRPLVMSKFWYKRQKLPKVVLLLILHAIRRLHRINFDRLMHNRNSLDKLISTNRMGTLHPLFRHLQTLHCPRFGLKDKISLFHVIEFYPKLNNGRVPILLLQSTQELNF